MVDHARWHVRSGTVTGACARLGWLFTCLLALALSGCSQDLPTFPFNPDPLFYLALSPAPDPSRPMHALVATMGTPVQSVYRNAETFEMKRAADGALFAWRTLPVSGRVPIGLRTVPDSIPANFVLDDQHGPALLSRADVVSGETYTIDIVTQGVTIHGQTTVPGQIAPVLDTVAGDTVVHWSAVAGAAGYQIIANLGSNSASLTTDTLVVLHTRFFYSDTVETIRVVALDQNLFGFLEDQTRTRGGINTGFGAFGAFTEARLTRRIP